MQDRRFEIEKIDDPGGFPGDSHRAQMDAYTKSHKFEPGEFPSPRNCQKGRHSPCAGFGRTWYGSTVTPWWPHDTYYDVSCTCSCHDDLHYKPRLKPLIGPRLINKPYKPEDFESRD